MIKPSIAPFIRPQRLKQLLMRIILMMYLNQSIVRFYQTYKNFLGKVRFELLIQLQMTILLFQSTDL